MLGLAARNGRFVLVAGLIAGAGLPGVAAQVLPIVPYMIGTLLFLNAFRSGERIWASIQSGFGRTAAIIVGLQLALPLGVLGLLLLSGIGLNAFTFAAVLMMSAPALTGAPNFVAMVGHDPTDAMRMLVVGTLFFPATAFVILWVLPGIDANVALAATVRLAVTILAVVVVGVFVRRFCRTRFDRDVLNLGSDDLTAILLFVVVIGLMAETGPLLRTSPGSAMLWIGAVLALNLVLQVGSLFLFRQVGLTETVSASVISGNRNIALFLIALPPEVMQKAMLFIGCYQIPMYLTPIIMRRLHSRITFR